MNILLETVVDSVAAAMAAEESGADRLELCSGLELGGLTPGIGLLRAVLAHVRIPVYVLIRCRTGDFHYRPDEHATHLAEVQAVRAAGAQGVVVGCLDEHGRLDKARMAELVSAAGPLSVTCHRAFDRVMDQAQALEDLIVLGIPRVLTSGGHASAYEGRFRLAELVTQAAGRIVVLAGAGVNAENARTIQEASGVAELHFSAMKRVEVSLPGQAMQAGMGAYGADADRMQFVPDGGKVLAVRAALGD